MVIFKNLLNAKYQENVGIGFTKTAGEVNIIKVSDLLAKTVFKFTFFCLNLMEVSHQD